MERELAFEFLSNAESNVDRWLDVQVWGESRGSLYETLDGLIGVEQELGRTSGPGRKLSDTAQ